ncbi:MAG TPA: Sec-independent protein translocase protein TatB [Beijerinckiaceae bacterium]|nr:Sec-independent protein translocase protein TatB [Beijerinckiaceae bacterium]
MFDFDAGKLLVIGIVALIVVGPKELPRVLRQFGQTLGKLRRMAAEFQSQFMDAVKEAELDGIRDDIAKMADQAQIEAAFDPIHTIRSEITEALADRPADGAPSLDLAGLNEAQDSHDFHDVDFLEAGVAPVAHTVESMNEQEPEFPFDAPAPAPAHKAVGSEAVAVAPSPAEPSEPSLMRKMGGI